MLSRFFEQVGEYVLMMMKVLTFPQRWRIFFKQYFKEVEKLGMDSIAIVIIISFFIGAVIVIQIALNMESPLLPRYTTGFASREILILEFSSAVMSLILAGKVGSNIASEIGAMRVSEQIDALEIMGVNSANYLILPKITALMSFIPILVVLSMFLGIVGGFAVCQATGIVSVADFEYGLQYSFKPFYVWYSIIKSVAFAYIIASVSAYYGYHVKGGSLAVGKASTTAVVMSSILILISDLVLTNLMMQ